MFAGTLTRLETPAGEPLSDYYRNGDLPALCVETVQRDLDGDRPVQAGTVASTVTDTREEIAVGRDADGNELGIDVERVETRRRTATEWVADVTGTGLIIPESIAGDGQFDFPLDVFTHVAGGQPERLEVDVASLFEAWDADDTLGDVWMNAAQDFDAGAVIEYDRGRSGMAPTIGLGFERPFGGSVMKGVVYASGYIACYSATSPTQFVRFVEHEVLEHTSVREEDEQETLTQEEMEEVTA